MLSLPRSGSTLLQRTLATHPDVGTVSEPWLLLPFVYATRAGGVVAEYGHEMQVNALADLFRQLPRGRDDYFGGVRDLTEGLYAKLAPAARYFVDKTPRYHLIAEELFEVFPDARFVFLWRNPLAVAASFLDTYSQGRWNLYWVELDLYQGVQNLTDAYRRHGDRSIVVRYEDLIARPQEVAGGLFEGLGLAFEPSLLSEIGDVTLAGSMGDQAGAARYEGISDEPLAKWRTTLANPFRRRWAERYLRWIGPDRLKLMGYDAGELLRELEQAPRSLRFLSSDLVRASVAPRLGRKPEAARVIPRRRPPAMS